MFFRGVSQLSLDAKGRVAMPARYRDRLAELCGGNLVITVDTYNDRCLWIYPQNEWEEIQSKLDKLPAFHPASIKLKRLLMGYAWDSEMDGAGRVLLSPALREYARLDRRVVLVGQGKKFELWDEDRWNAGRDQWLEQGVLGGDSDLPPELTSLDL